MNVETLPEHWKSVQLEEIASLRRENIKPEGNRNLNYVGLEHIDSGESQLKRWGDASEVKSAKSRFYPDDVLYGKLRPYLDKAALAEMGRDMLDRYSRSDCKLEYDSRIFDLYSSLPLAYWSCCGDIHRGKSPTNLVEFFGKIHLFTSPTPRTTRHCPGFTDNPRSQSRTPARN